MKKILENFKKLVQKFFCTENNDEAALRAVSYAVAAAETSAKYQKMFGI